MKKLIVRATVTMMMLAACNNPASQKKNVASDKKKTEIAGHYTCTMHPEVSKDKPGVCPKCGMELVEKDN